MSTVTSPSGQETVVDLAYGGFEIVILFKDKRVKHASTPQGAMVSVGWAAAGRSGAIGQIL